MFMALLTLAAAAAPAPAPAPTVATTPAGRGLRDIPNTTITYYDVPGRTGPAIEQSLKKILADPAAAANTRLFNYNIAAQIMKSTTGTVCTIKSATATLTPTVHLPRLAEEAKVPKPVLANWRTYIASVEEEAGSSLWFVSDRVAPLAQSLTGLNCDQANGVWNAGLEKLRTQLLQFSADRAAAAKAAAAKKK